MTKSIFFISILIAISFSGNSQSKTQYLKIGDKSFDKGDYQGAVVYYQKAMEYDSLDLDLMYKYAQSFRLTNSYKKAEYYYNKVYFKDGGREYPKAVFWLATMQKMNGKYLESYKTWKHVKTIFRRGNSFENKKAKQEIRGSAFARRAEKYRNDAIIKNIGDGVNTNASEFSPIVQDGVLYFSSLRAKEMGVNGEVYDEIYSIKLYSALQKDSLWEMEKELPMVINSPQFHSANGCFGLDGKQFYFSRCDKKSRCDIFVSEYKNGKWNTAKKLTINVIGGSTTQPMSCMINEKEHLFFASNRSGGLGKMDIWYSIKDNNGKFGKPIHTGKNVNSPDNEITPFYNTVTNELYFSSDWHPGLGGFDIFKSGGNLKRLSRPINLGAPINTQWNEMYYFIDTISETNYLVSNREEGKGNLNSTCCNDIYSINFPRKIPPNEVDIITLEDLNKYLPVTLYFHNDRPNPRTTKTNTELNYMTTYQDYMSRIPIYRKEYSKGLSGLKEEEAILDIDDFFKDFVEKGVKDLAFFTELLFLELEKGTEIELTVKGFASPLAKTDYNVNLTSRRISSLVNYLNEFENGKFKKYIQGGKLKFKEVPFGEYTASNLVSDNLNDKRNSVYSRAAALERKIEIQSVNLLNKSDSVPRITFDKESKDLGKVKNGTPLEVEFTISNDGNAPLKIFEIEGSCSCTVIDLDEFTLAKGDSKTIKATINTEQLFGKTTKTIAVRSNAIPKEKVFVVTFEVIENK